MPNLLEKWKKHNKEGEWEGDGLFEPWPFDVWYEWELRSQKRNLLNAIVCMRKWKKGFYSKWVYLLSKKFKMPKKEVQEKIINPLISEGVIEKNGSTIAFRALLSDYLEKRSLHKW